MKQVRVLIKSETFKPPLEKEDGSADLYIRAEMPPNMIPYIPGTTTYIVHVHKGLWKNIKDKVKPNTVFKIHGEQIARVTKQGLVIIVVSCHKITISGDKATEVQEKHNEKIEKIEKQLEIEGISIPNLIHQKIRVNEGVTKLKVSDISIQDEMHLECKSLWFGNALKNINRNRQIQGTVFVQAIEGGKYKLIMGLKTLAMAKILDIEEIDGIITDKNHQELVQEFNIKENTSK